MIGNFTNIFNYLRPSNMPWLYYGLLSGESAESIAAKEPSISLDVTPGSYFSKLPFVLAVYDSKGTFVGLQNLTTDLQVLIFCLLG